MSDDSRICEVGGSGIFLPLGGDGEQLWPQGVRAVLYLIGLGWCFMGVALISDVFMGAIETITSKKVRRRSSETGRWVTELLWNPTVANLTLMALGSSAPEILLSIIELLANDWFSGDLGPSTIVGSAAFNLLCITAVCVCTIPNKETRRIKDLRVYAVTASTSVFAYLWLLFILLGVSENVVEWWEGLLTFLFFPLLVLSAYIADVGCCCSRAPKLEFGHVVSVDMSKEELATVEASIRRRHGSQLTDDQVAKFLECERHPSRAHYRVAATRDLTGGRRVNVPQQAAGRHSIGLPLFSVMPLDSSQESQEESTAVRFEFEAAKHGVLESAGDLMVPVRRLGNLTSHARVRARTCDGSAKAGTDYQPIDIQLDFAPGCDRQVVTLRIIDDATSEDVEEFYVELLEPQAVGTSAGLGGLACTTVIIIDDDLPGTLEFEDDTLVVPEQVADFEIDVPVHRKGGSTGRVGCKYRTEDGSAISPADYGHMEGELEMEHGQISAAIRLTIKASGRYERSEQFRLILEEPSGGVQLDPKSDGGPDATILTIVIQCEPHAKARVDKLMDMLQVNWHKTKVGNANWREQFAGALLANGGEEASLPDYLAHAVLLPWKLLFALVPPADYAGGWLCFWCALGMIAFCTAVIGDLAGLLGCVLEMPDAVTAITLVALGTSLPDTFASKTAAMQDPYADASIGNVTGSNSVNVFLGLGLPWTMAAIYWQARGPSEEWLRRYGSEPWLRDWQGGAFVVPAGSIAFSVAVFSGCAFACIVVLYARRRLLRGELGGPVFWKYATGAFFVCLWLFYIAMSTWYVCFKV